MFAKLDHLPDNLVGVYYCISPVAFARGQALVLFPIPLHVRLFLFAEKAPPISPEVAADRHHPKALCTILLLVVTTRLRLVGVPDVDRRNLLCSLCRVFFDCLRPRLQRVRVRYNLAPLSICIARVHEAVSSFKQFLTLRQIQTSPVHVSEINDAPELNLPLLQPAAEFGPVSLAHLSCCISFTFLK